MLSLIIGLGIVLILWIVEFNRHQMYRKKIPVIIHINGTRGKSSVTRLVAAGLRAGEKKTLAKTTGSAPRFIFENGSEVPVVRYFGANIKEQLKIIKYAAKRNIDILVLECMAVNPEYQWVTEHKMVKANVCVITNSRLDHLDVMGPGIKNVTLSMCNTLPHNGIAFTSEKKMFPLMKNEADKLHTKLQYSDGTTITDDEMKGFDHIEHKENVALSLDVCEHLGVPKKFALLGMYEAQPDVGAAEIFRVKHNEKTIYFAHSFAANDPESTIMLLNYIKQLHPEIDGSAIVLSTREDRMFRSEQLAGMITEMDFDMLYLIGKQEAKVRSYALSANIPDNKIAALGWQTGDQLLEEVMKIEHNEILLLGIGNIHGNGHIIVEYFKERNRKNV
jgi:gamma-polyglutamate synthase